MATIIPLKIKFCQRCEQYKHDLDKTRPCNVAFNSAMELLSVQWTKIIACDPLSTNQMTRIYLGVI